MRNALDNFEQSMMHILEAKFRDYKKDNDKVVESKLLNHKSELMDRIKIAYDDLLESTKTAEKT